MCRAAFAELQSPILQRRLFCPFTFVCLFRQIPFHSATLNFCCGFIFVLSPFFYLTVIFSRLNLSANTIELATTVNTMATIELLPMPNGTISAQLLDPEHFQALDTAMENILSLDTSRDTLAQLFDGIPTISVLFEARGVRHSEGAPVQEHKTLCDGAMDRAKAFIAAFDLLALQFDPVVCTRTRISE